MVRKRNHVRHGPKKRWVDRCSKSACNRSRPNDPVMVNGMDISNIQHPVDTRELNNPVITDRVEQDKGVVSP